MLHKNYKKFIKFDKKKRKIKLIIFYGKLKKTNPLRFCPDLDYI
jgi:hypothetical protein